MADHDEQDPKPPPEALLIRRRRMVLGWSTAEAAAATDGQVSPRRWVQIEQGYVGKGGARVPTTASDSVLAHMAAALGVTPEQLIEVDRQESAEVLRMIVAERGVIEREHTRQDREILRRMAEFFEDDSVSADEKRIMAERFFRVLPYYVAGQRPPRELLAAEDDDPPANGSSKSA